MSMQQLGESEMCLKVSAIEFVGFETFRWLLCNIGGVGGVAVEITYKLLDVLYSWVDVDVSKGNNLPPLTPIGSNNERIQFVCIESNATPYTSLSFCMLPYMQPTKPS